MARLVGPCSLLIVFGVAAAAGALGRGVPAFDDHPGQIYRAWHVVAHGWAPWAWNPGWWAGYPELQFYPPLYSWLVAGLHAGTLGALPLESAYAALLWLTYLAPGVTVLALLARRLDSGWLALPGAGVALLLSAGLASGIEGGVHIGMAPARLGWALVPLVPLALERWTTGVAPLPIRRVAALIAAIVLTHPAHAPVTAASVALAAVARAPRRRRLGTAASALALAAAITGVWSVPLVARLANTRALAWGSLAPADAVLRAPLAVLVIVLAAAAVRLARSPADRVLAWLPWAGAAIVAVDALLLEPLGVRWLPAYRVADAAGLAVVIAAGLAAGHLLERVRRTPRAALGTVAAGLAIVLGAFDGTLSLPSQREPWPTIAETTRGLRLDALWSTLARAPDGRALFVRSGVPLVYGTEWWRPHTHVTSLAPMHAGRDIVNATFTHPAPVAAFVYRGAADAGAITSLVERHDGRTLLGRPLEELDTAFLELLADRLGVSVVVALDEDVPHLERLLAGGRPHAVGPFVVLESARPRPVPHRVDRGRWHLALDASRGGWTSARVAYYPLWQAAVNGTPVDTRRGDDAMLEIALPAGSAAVELTYAAGTPEHVGAVVSLVGLLGLATGLRRRRRRVSA